jgi:hypothetical protein
MQEEQAPNERERRAFDPTYEFGAGGQRKPLCELPKGARARICAAGAARQAERYIR